MRNIFVLFVMVALLFSCAPKTKEAYIEDYKNFMKELSEESSSYSETEWKIAEKKYELYSGEWYDMFSKELSVKEKVVVAGYDAKFKYLKALGKTKDAINDVVDDLNKEESGSIKEYIENDLEDDVDEIGKKVEKLGEELVEGIEDLAKDLDL